MNRATIGFYLAVVLGSCSMNGVSQADELLTRDDFFVADESRHQWVTEHNGRTGALNVKGALVSSPCILDTPEVNFPCRNIKGDMYSILRYHVVVMGILTYRNASQQSMGILL